MLPAKKQGILFRYNGRQCAQRETISPILNSLQMVNMLSYFLYVLLKIISSIIDMH